MERASHTVRSPAVLASLVGGSALLVTGWALTVWHLKPWSELWYTIVWTGFIVAGDGVVAAKTGRSLMLDRPRELVSMVVVSAALWWLFEIANAWLFDSWSYTPSPDVPRWWQRTRSTVAFATLIPATWQATLLALCFTRPRSIDPVASRGLACAAIAGGVAVGALIVPFRTLALPISLVSLGLVTDAVNLLRGRTSLLAQLRAGAWRVPLCISLGNIAAGVLGELWNYPADPKWTYRVPYADVWRLFEMPLPGYLGYAALALDLFALYHLVRVPRRPDAPLAPKHPLTATGLG